MSGKVIEADFSPEDLTLLRMVCAVARIAGIDADTLAEEFVQASKIQAYHGCFAKLVAEKLGYDEEESQP